MGNLIGFSALKRTTISNQAVLRMGLTTSGTVGTRTLCLGKRNIALANLSGYALLCVFNDTSASANPQTACITGVKYTLAQSGKSYVLVGSQPSDKTPVNSIVIGNVPIAVNASGELVVFDATIAIGTPDEEDTVFIASAPIRVVRKGNNWYLGVKA